MTTRRPGAPRRAGRPVVASRAKRAGGGAAASRTRPAAAARARTSAPLPEADDGPLLTVTRRALVLVAVIVLAAGTLVPALNSYVAQSQQLSALQDQVAAQQDELASLQKDVDRWEDPNFVAAQARERLLYAMPGETQYRLMDSSGAAVPLTEREQQEVAAAQGEWYDTLWSSVEGASRAETAGAGIPPADGGPADPSRP
ncbi:septum formation initiator family protein [Brachybacterium sp. JHP9]|uniref:Septum formation initiator family protein n=1 Tax=Brachybacterium equifaecis TaxID=2910770 RepID=A0ABT0QX69_9MICO|nr:septum formation initiator family protein [Brachybacterium equifaecis]MCL6421788.1 septum formation initiator family protein [Brachybacterium equifaecis]